MSPDRIYRFSIWLPLIVPMAVIVVMNVLLKGFGMPKPSGLIDVALETLAWSAIFGGLPYIVLALWATWWIRGRSEPAIRRVMFLAPLLMVGAFGTACLIMGTVGDRMEIWIRIWARGASIMIPLGYAYIALTLLLRRWLGSRTLEGTS
jgi:hypothetical protein